MKKIKIEFTNERIIPASGLAVVGAILGKCDFVKRCNRMDVTPTRREKTHNRFWETLEKLVGVLDDWFSTFQKPNAKLAALCSFS